MKLVLIPLILFTTNIFAYDLELKCGENGELKSHKLKGMQKANDKDISSDLFKSTCNNLEDCMANLGFIGKLSKSTNEILTKYLEDDNNWIEELKKNKKKSRKTKQIIQDMKKENTIYRDQLAQRKDLDSEYSQGLFSMDLEIQEKSKSLNILKQQLKDIEKPFKKLFNKKKIVKLKDLIKTKKNNLKETISKKSELFEKKSTNTTSILLLQNQIKSAEKEIVLLNNDVDEIKSLIKDGTNNINTMLTSCNSNEHSSKLKNGKKLTLYYPYNGRGNNKTSSQYDVEAIESIMGLAIQGGVDPYLALSIVLIENAPTRSYGSYLENNGYAQSYGAIPVDAIAAYNNIGCIRAPSKGGYNSPITTPKSVRKMRIGSGNTKTRFCSSDSHVSLAASPRFSEASNNASGCCVDIIGKSNIKPIEVKTAIGIRVLKNMQNNIQKDSKRFEDKGKYFALGFNSQRFNGVGTFGASESMDNPCLNGVKMADRPVYGLLVQDFMANTLMNNPAIQDIVNNLSKRYKKKPISNLCMSFGKGNQDVDTSIFLSLQKELLLNYKGKAQHGFASSERNRKKACSRNGKVTFEKYSKDHFSN